MREGERMDGLRNLWLRLRSLFGAASLERELDEELRFHLEAQAARHVRQGMTPAAARRRAQAEFGGVDRIAEECREARTGSALHLALRALRLGVRRLGRDPSFAVPAVATLAIGFGALLAIFTLADAVLLRPLPYADSDRIVVLRHALPGFGIADAGQSDGTFVHYREAARSFESMGAYFDRELSITDGAAPERVLAALVTPGVLDVLQLRPLLGRAFTAEDVTPEGRVLLSYELWQRRFGGDPGIVGGHIEVNGTRREVLGVLPRGAAFPTPATQLLFATSIGADRAGLRDMYFSAIARLRPGVTPALAEAELSRLAGTLGDRFADAPPELLAEAGFTPRVRRLKDEVTGDVRPALVLLLCTAAFVVLIALANVANLALVRAEHQRAEVAVERALGAGGGAVVLRFATESALVTFGGAALGLALAALAVGMRFGFEPWQIPRLHEVALTGRTVGLALACAALAGAALTLVGWLRGARADVHAALRGSLHRTTAGRESWLLQNGLTAAQIALACALVIGAGVMMQSVARLARVELGFRPGGLVAFDFALPTSDYRPYGAAAGFVDRLREGLLALPGVDAAEAVSLLPLTPYGSWFEVPIASPGVDVRGGVEPVASVRLVTPGYFAALGIPLLGGRVFEPADLTDAGAGVVLAESLARRLFGDADPVGRAVELPGLRHGTLIVVGVAGDVRDASLASPPAPLLYLPNDGRARLTDGVAPLPFVPREGTLIVRSDLPPAALLPAMREVQRGLDARLPIANLRTLDDVVAASSSRARLTAWLLLAGAASALLLGVVGIYGVVAYAVSRRGRELALRIALGASPGRVRRMVLAQGAAVALAGVAAGIPIALALTRLLGGLLFEVSPTDARTFVLVPLGMLIVALLASSLPARRAARTEPASALTAE
jgi:putative ABC transport system permease protein